MLLILFMTIILLTAPMLSVEASVKGSSNKLQVDLSNGVVENGYFSLPIDKSSEGLIFNLSYTVGYIDEASNTFIAMATHGIDSREWRAQEKVSLPLDSKIITLNNVKVFSYRDQYHLDNYRVPVLLNGKEISLDILFNGDVGKITYTSDGEGNEISIKNGDVLIPIFTRYKDGKEIEDLIQKDKKITYNDKSTALAIPVDPDKVAFRIYAQSTYAGGHSYSDIIVPAKFITTNTNSNITPTPSTWAKADIDKAKESGLTTERVLKDYQKSITREEFCELTINLYEKLSGKIVEIASPNPFKDTANITVLKAYKLGIANGTGNEEFSPDKPLNREQMAKMFFSTLQMVYPNIGEVVEELNFSDKEKISVWAKQAVKYMFKEKIILGSNNQFSPQQEASREQAIVLVYRVFEKYKN